MGGNKLLKKKRSSRVGGSVAEVLATKAQGHKFPSQNPGPEADVVTHTHNPKSREVEKEEPRSR